MEGLKGLGGGNWLPSHEPTLRKVTLKLRFRLQSWKGSTPAPARICCVVLSLFLNTPDSVSLPIKMGGDK